MALNENVPVHVANEYCRKEHSTDLIPYSNEDKLPRKLTVYNLKNDIELAWFPYVVSKSSSLGVDFAIRMGAHGCAGRGGSPWIVGGVAMDFRPRLDLETIDHLDKIRTAELTKSRENLKFIDPISSPSQQ